MGLFTAVGKMLNTSAEVGMWITILAAVILVAIIIIVIASISNKKKNDDFDFTGLEQAFINNDAKQEPSEDNEEFISLKTDEQFEAAKFKKVVATVNEDIAYEQAQTAEIQNENVSSKKSAAKTESKKKQAAVTENKEKETVIEQKPAKKAGGKWVIEHKKEGEYLSKLLASNGEVMLTSEIYTTVDGAKGGISTIVKGVDTGKFVVYQDKNGNYYYKLKTASNRLLCVGEIYKSKDQCLKAVESVKRFAGSATVSLEVFEGAQYVAYNPAPLSNDYKKGTRGKWKIDKNSDGEFCAKLFASNGQLMLATEVVTQRKTAINAITAVKKNAEIGNFIIDRDKFGRFYYKLRNSQKSVICIGEAYDTLESCTSAIESVRRFALSAIVPGENE